MNHVVFRKRTPDDDMNSFKREPVVIDRQNSSIILPEPRRDPVVFWSRDLKSSRPESFKTLDEYILSCTTWPTKTNILCNHCCHKFDTTPVPLPQTYDSVRKIYNCRGIFCSWQCAKAFNMNSVYSSGMGNRNMYISLLAHRMWVKYKCHKPDSVSETEHDKLHRYSVYNIDCAPPKEVLVSFGGSVSIEDYRSGFFGIVPPDETVAGDPFLTIRQKLCLPFSSRTTLNNGASNTSMGASVNHSSGSMRKIDRSVSHQYSNDFCKKLNEAKSDKALAIKRKRNMESKNTLMSSMGVKFVSNSK